MLIHLECNTEVNGAVDSPGGAVFVCPKCGLAWTAEWNLQTATNVVKTGSSAWARADRLRRVRPEWFPASD